MLGREELLYRIRVMDQGLWWDLTHQYSVCFDHPASDILSVASSRGIVDVVQMLLQEPSADPSYKDNYAIKWASFFGKTEVVRMLLATGKVDVTAKNFALIKASGRGHIEVVRLLLEHGACAFAENNQAFCDASQHGRLDVLRLLLKHGADPSVRDNFPLRIAIPNYHIEVVRFLLDLGFLGDKRIVIDPSMLGRLVDKKEQIIRIFKGFEGFRDHALPIRSKHLKRLIARNTKFYRMEQHIKMVDLLLSYR
jgi:ankyrin repeat protein